MSILGISCFYHDAAAALLQEGRLVAAAEEERFTRQKHDSAFPLRAIEFCLERGNVRASDLDYVVFYEKPFQRRGVQGHGDGDMDYFSYHDSSRRTFNAKFEALFGKPRDSHIPFFTAIGNYPAYYGERPLNFGELAVENQR